MESSQCVRRCLLQILRSPTRRSIPASNGGRIICTNYLPMKPTTTATIRRSFTTTISQQEQQPEPSASQTPGSNRSIADQKGTEEPRQQKRYAPSAPRVQRSQRQFRPRDTQRIDLSSIPGMPSSYRPPPPSKNPEQAEAAAAKLKALFDENRPIRTSSSSSSPSLLTRTRSDQHQNRNTYSPLDAYTTSPPTSPRQTRSTYDLDSLMDVITTKPQKLDYLSQSATDTPMTTLRLRPTLGRTVDVVPAKGFNLTRAFRTLEIKCNANNVKRDARDQKYHRRKGQRVKMERSARWRVLFREGFLAECARVRRMRVQGW